VVERPSVVSSCPVDSGASSTAFIFSTSGVTMNSQSGIETTFAYLRINLIIALPVEDRYLVRVGPEHLGWHRIDWPGGHGAIAGLGAHIEAATLLSLGVRVTYVDLVSVVMPDAFVLVQIVGSMLVPRQDSRAVTISELIGQGADPGFVRLLQLAADRLLAEKFATGISAAVASAMSKSVGYLLDGFTIEDGRAGWSEDLAKKTVGVLSSAQGVLSLLYAHERSDCIEPAIQCLEHAQNDDGGWRVRHALAGQPSAISITESTCYCLLALAEAGRPIDGLVVAQGIGWLMDTQRSDGGWGSSKKVDHSQVVATALAVRALVRIGFRQTALRGANWLRSVQRENGAWSFVHSGDPHRNRSAVAPTAHAVISLLAVDVPASDMTIVKACRYIRSEFSDRTSEAPWRSSTWKTSVDERSRLNFHHYATPWALAALITAGNDFGDPLILNAVKRLLAQQESNGSWVDSTFAHQSSLWAVHDAVFALKVLISTSEANLAAVALRVHYERTITMWESLVAALLSESLSERAVGSAVVGAPD
jgi:prenyltransferase beta subunit